MKELEHMVVRFIPYGEDNAISRHELVNLTHLTDREVRALIASAREEQVILSRPSGGYYKPTPAEAPNIRSYLAKEKKRAVSIFKSIKYAKKFLADIERGAINGRC